MRWLCLLTITAALAVPPAAFDFEAADPAWRHKDNTTVDFAPPTPFAGAGALRFTVDPAPATYGWVHRALPEGEYQDVVGLHGVWRAEAGARGVLRAYVCVSSPGQDLSYFGGDLGRLSDSQGEWLEFYLPLRELRWERGPVRSLQPAALGTADLLQFMAHVDTGRPTAIDLDQVRFVTADAAASLAPRLRAQQRERQLLPPERAGGAPHPRLLLTPERVAALRAKATAGGEVQAAYERLLALAEQMLTSYPADNPLRDVYEFVNTSTAEGVAWRATFEGRLVNASYPLETLAAAYRLTGDERFGRHAATALVAAAGRLTVDEPFLSRGFYYTRTLYVRALAFAYDWVWDLLTPGERRLVQTTLLGFVTDIHTHSLSDGWGARPLQRVWNWDPGLMGACGVGMLALEGETRVAEQAILFECRRHLRDYLTLGIDSDGCGHEGPNYLGYGMGAGVEFVEALRQQGRGDLFTETNYRLVPVWLAAETLPGGRRWNNLSDGGYSTSIWPAHLYACGRLAELAASRPEAAPPWEAPTLLQPLGFLQHFEEAPGPLRLGYPTLAGVMGWVWAQGPGRSDPAGYDARAALAHVLFYQPCPPLADPAAVLPLGQHFRGRGLVVSRTGFGADDFHLAVEAGPHAAGHDQSDKGTFTFRAYGGDLAVDSGYGNDNDPQKSTSGYAHNVVLIDGAGQPMRYHNNSSGYVTGFHTSAVADWVRVDAREAWNVRYGADWTPEPLDSVQRAERSLVFVRPRDGVPGYLVVYDDIAKDAAEHAYTWQWHIPASMQFEASPEGWLARPRVNALPLLTTAADAARGSATFTLTAPQAGRYRVYGLVRAGGEEIGKSDSFFVTVDDGEALTWDLGTADTLGWDAVEHRGEGQPRVFELAAGEHRVTIGAREPQAQVAGLMLVPEGAPEPDPDAAENAPGFVGAGRAVLGDPPLLRQAPAPAEEGASAWTVPLHPRGGEVSTGWFTTSREGAHPRLQYTVRSADPRLLVVMVPQRAGTPRPQVEPIENDQAVGAVVRWPGVTDRLVFARGAAELGGVALDGAAALLRLRGDEVAGWALLDGRRLAWAGRELVGRPQPVAEAGP